MYTSHFIERVVCERELETKQNCNILTPTLMAITAFLSRSTGLLNRGPGGSASAGTCSHSSIFSPIPTAQSGVLRAPSVVCWFSLQHPISNWLTSCLHPGYMIVLRPLNSTRRQSRSPLISWYLRPDAPVIYTGAFLLLTAWPGRRLICNTSGTLSWRP